MQFISRSLRIAAVPLAYVVLALMWTWPLAADVGGNLGGGLDPQLQSWVLAWDTHALTTHPFEVWQPPIFFPYPDTLAYSDHHLLLTLLAAPVIWISGNPALAHNLLVILSYAMSGLAVYLLARELWPSSESSIAEQIGQLHLLACFVAGAAFAFCAFRMAQFVHLQMLQTAWLPLALLFLMRVLRTARWRDGLLCGLFFAIQAVTALYFAYFALLTLGLYAGLWAVWMLWRRVRHTAPFPWRIVPRLLVGGLLAVAIVVPMTLPYLRVYQSLGVVRSLRELEHWSAPLQAYLAVDPGNWILGRFALFQASGGEFALFPGMIVSILALVGALWGRAPVASDSDLRNRLFLAMLALLAFILSLGTVLRVVRGGDTVPIPLPYGLLYDRLPGFGALRVPARWGMLVALSACLLAARGLVALGHYVSLIQGSRSNDQRKGAKAQRTVGLPFAPLHLCVNVPFSVVGGWLPLAALVLVLAESGTALPLTRAPDLAAAPPVYAWLAAPEQADIRAVLELPAGRTQRGEELAKTMLRQYYGSLHWKRLATGYSGVIPFGTTDLLGRAQQLPEPEAIQFLQLVGIDTLVVHRMEYSPEALQKLTVGLDSSTLIRKRAEVGDTLIYTLIPFQKIDLPAQATVLLTSDERAPGLPALALARRWAQGGTHVYGAPRIRYYAGLNLPPPGYVFDYALLADGEDPQPYGFGYDRQVWQAARLALYARDPQLVVNLELGVVPTRRFHPVYPSKLDIRLAEREAQIGEQRIAWTQPITQAVVEVDVASLIAQQLTTPVGPMNIPAGASRVLFPTGLGQLVHVTGQADRTAIMRVRVRAGLPQPGMPTEPGIAATVESRIVGSRFSADVKAAGVGSVLIEVRGAAAADDRPIVVFQGIQPLLPQGGSWSFSTDLLAPNEPWQQEKHMAVDGRYIMYMKDANHAQGPGVPIAQYRVRAGQVIDAEPVVLPLMALP